VTCDKHVRGLGVTQDPMTGPLAKQAFSKQPRDFECRDMRCEGWRMDRLNRAWGQMCWTRLVGVGPSCRTCLLRWQVWAWSKCWQGLEEERGRMRRICLSPSADRCLGGWRWLCAKDRP